MFAKQKHRFKIAEKYDHDGRKNLIPVKQLRGYDSYFTPEKFSAWGGHRPTNFKDSFGNQLTHHDLRNMHHSHDRYLSDKKHMLDNRIKSDGTRTSHDVLAQNARNWYNRIEPSKQYTIKKNEADIISAYVKNHDDETNQKWKTVAVDVNLYMKFGDYRDVSVIMHDVSLRQAFDKLEHKFGKHLAGVNGLSQSVYKDDENIKANIHNQTIEL